MGDRVPGDQDGVVVMEAKMMTDGVGQFVMIIVQRSLPTTETGQRLVSIMRDLQFRLPYAHT